MSDALASRSDPQLLFSEYCPKLASVVRVLQQPAAIQGSACTVRYLCFASADIQSAAVVGRPDILVLAYTRLMASALVALHGGPQSLRTLHSPFPSSIALLGCGGASLPSFLMHHADPRRLAILDVVDLSPVVFKTALQFFGLNTLGDRVRLVESDALSFLLRSGPREARYEALLVDVFNASGLDGDSISTSFLEGLVQRLLPEGCLVYNFWARHLEDAVPWVADRLSVRGFYVYRFCEMEGEVSGNVVIGASRRRVVTGTFPSALFEPMRSVIEISNLSSPAVSLSSR